ncbi:MAG: NAD(+) diphosphatase [Lentisphaerae bacterium]|nr:NAD(+) diphosphatase [Lentisphaerota bacterium]
MNSASVANIDINRDCKATMFEQWHFQVAPYTEFPCRENDLCLLFNPAGELLPAAEDNGLIHFCGYGCYAGQHPQDAVFLGYWEEKRCYAVTLTDQDCETRKFFSLREILAHQNAEMACLACMGKQLLDWRKHTRYCSACGVILQEKTEERARVCPACGELYYPRISPAVIVAVHRDEKILLAHNVNFAPGVYSLVAGYVEPGESLEQAVAREVREEVGLQIRGIRYWGSQAWPFPSSTLMVGFEADYASGDICPDGQEISEAGWFALNQLPSLHRPGSISRRIIDSLCARQLR